MSNAVETLRRRDLEIPVEGVRSEQLRDTFAEGRGGRFRLRPDPRGAGVPGVARMTTLPDRPNSALLVIDVQNGVMAGGMEAEDD